MDIPLATQLAESESTYVSDADLINLMLVVNPPGSRKPFHIASTPSLASVASQPTGTARVRGMCRRKDTGDIYVVKGTSIFKGSPNSWGASLGTMPGTGFCRMIDAVTHVVIVDGTNARCVRYTDDNVSTPSIEGWIDAVYMDGYTIYADLGSTSFYVSSLDDPTTINALDFTTADAIGGTIVGLATIGRELFVVKTGSIETYYNAGGNGFPYVRSSPGFIETSCWPREDAGTDTLKGVNAIQAFGGALYWLSHDMIVYEMRGYSVRRISTPAIEKYLSENYRLIQRTAFGTAYNIDGVGYYSITFDGGNELALVYNINAGLWHRHTSSLASADFITHAVLTDVGITVAIENSSADTGTIYTLDPGGSNDTGASSQVSRTMTLPQLDYGSTRAFMPEIMLDMEKPATSGTITLSWSDDGGSNYTDGVTNSGANARTRWQRLGSFYQRNLRFDFSIDSKIAIVGVRARIEVGE